MTRAFALAVGVLMPVLAYAQFEASFDVAPDDPAIGYTTRPVRDRVEELSRKVAQGKITLHFDERQGYLPSVLEALQIPVESQIVVFSKTSVQAPYISPANPRTLFFNDSVVVGWVHGGFMEIAAHDPEQGVVFYTLDQSAAENRTRAMVFAPPPLFRRQDDCLGCHVSYATLGVSGMLTRSVYPDRNGVPVRQLGDFVTDHRSPLKERWGGWYVTGKNASVQHLGNMTIEIGQEPNSKGIGTILPSLKNKFDADAYLSPHSDVAALMVFNHQMHMINLLTRVGWEVRLSTSRTGAAVRPQLTAAVHELVDYMLFVDEALLSQKMEGTSGFQKVFESKGPWDRKGRSLRQLDLEHRLLRYPCSYMIYSDAFDALPKEARDAIFHRLWAVLSGEERGASYQRLSLAERKSVAEILRDTKAGLPEYFRSVIIR